MNDRYGSYDRVQSRVSDDRQDIALRVYDI